MRGAMSAAEFRALPLGPGRERTRPGQRDPGWSPEESEYVVAARLRRETIPAIAAALGRTNSSVENQWLRLRLDRGLPQIRGHKPFDQEAAFWSKVHRSDDPGSCWPWQSKSRTAHGYGCIQFDMGAGRKLCGAHRVAFFLANGRAPAAGLDVMHSCDNKSCCNPAHLSEGTRSQNSKDAYLRGRTPKLKAVAGEAHHRALLTETQVRAIRRLREGGAYIADIAEAAGVKPSTIHHILAGRNWAHVQ